MFTPMVRSKICHYADCLQKRTVTKLAVLSLLLTAVIAVPFTTYASITTVVPVAQNEQSAAVKIIGLLSERLRLSTEVAVSKWNNRRPIHDPRRAQEVLQSAVEQGKRRNLPLEYVERVFSDQIAASESVQYALHSRWSLNQGLSDLSVYIESTRSKLTALTPQILETLDDLRLHQQSHATCIADIHSATEGKIDSNGWEDERASALRFATAQLCF